MTHDAIVNKQETDLNDGIQDLTLEPKQDTQNSTDIPAPPLDCQRQSAKGKIGEMIQQHQHTK